MRTRSIATVLIAAALTVALVQPADAARPVRSGTVIGNHSLLLTGPGGCETAPDCLAWLADGCSPRLAGHDPAVTASIVDVRKLAGTRRLLVSGPWLASVVEFWSARCREVGEIMPRRWTGGFTVPKRARWMTIPGAGVGPNEWALY